MPLNLKDEFTRVVPLVLAGVALLGWILFGVSTSNKRSEGHDYRVQLREMATARQGLTAELAQQRQASGSFSELQARITAGNEQLATANTAAEQAKAQREAVQKDIETRVQQEAQLAQELQTQTQQLSQLRLQAGPRGSAAPDGSRE